jgi:hypothetical protein
VTPGAAGRGAREPRSGTVAALVNHVLPHTDSQRVAPIYYCSVAWMQPALLTGGHLNMRLDS